MSGDNGDCVRPMLADRYFNISLAEEWIAPAPIIGSGKAISSTDLPNISWPMAWRLLNSGVSLIRVLSIFRGLQIRSITRDSKLVPAFVAIACVSKPMPRLEYSTRSPGFRGKVQPERKSYNRSLV